MYALNEAWEDEQDEVEAEITNIIENNNLSSFSIFPKELHNCHSRLSPLKNNHLNSRKLTVNFPRTQYLQLYSSIRITVF